MITEPIRLRIKELLDEKGLSATAFSKIANMTQTTVCRQMAGSGEVSVELIQAILTTYPEISADWLVMGRGPKVRSEQHSITANAVNNSTATVDMSHSDGSVSKREMEMAVLQEQNKALLTRVEDFQKYFSTIEKMIQQK